MECTDKKAYYLIYEPFDYRHLDAAPGPWRNKHRSRELTIEDFKIESHEGGTITINSYYREYNEQNTAKDFLQKSIDTIKERGKDYDTNNEEERSFQAVADAFTAKTGIELQGYHIALILSDLKDVRQLAQDRLHEDSLLDGVAYKALFAEEVTKHYKGN